MTLELIRPDWPAPPQVRACTTTRLGGISETPWHSLNLGDHVGDDPARVTENRRRLREALALPGEPLWLRQVHGCDIADPAHAQPAPCADAASTREPGRICAVLTADCLPLLVCNTRGDRVAAIHAGWRGLAAGVIERTLDGFEAHDELLVWLGPAIGPRAFEVGADVRDCFLAHDPACDQAFASNRPGHWLADLYQLARRRLPGYPVVWVGGGDCCTYHEESRFFSFRRDGVTGRMASMIWIRSSAAEDQS